MEKTGLYNKGRIGLEFIEPVKLVAGQKRPPNVFILKETTATVIDSIPINTPAGTIVVNVDGFWGISGTVQAKEIIDVSSGNLPSTDVLKDDIFLIGVGGTVNGIALVSGDKLQAKKDNPTQTQTGGTFDDWILIEAPKVSSTNIQRPNGDSVETSLVNLETNKVDKVVGKQLSTEDYTTAEKNKLANIADGAEVNVQSDYNQTDNTQDDFIKNKPNLGTVANKDVGNQIGEIQENGDTLGSLEIVETNAIGKFITATKNTAYNKNFGTTNGDVARGDASYLKADTYTQAEINNALATNSNNDRARANHTGTQAITTITGLQTALDSKEATANKGQANGYASLDGSAKVPASQLPSYVDDVVEYANLASFPITGETGKIYIALDTNLTYRWSGSTYVSLNDVDLTDYFNKTTNTTDDIIQGTAKFTTQADIDKLAGIEENATADQTDAEIKIAYENNANTNAFTDAEKTKLAGIDDFAQVNIQSDLAATTGDAFILNKSTQYISDSFDKRYVTESEKTLLSNTSGINTGDETTISIQTKRPLKTIEGQSLEGAGNIDLTKADVGLANVDNTSDVNKPVSTAQQTALDGKLAKASNLSDVSNRQAAVNNLTNASSAANEQVLTKDTTTGNAIFKPIPSLQALLPTGSIVMSIATSLTGALKFDGVSAYSKSIYSNLYTILSSIVGTAFDVDANNFYLPNPAGRVLGIAGFGRTLFDLVGSDTHALNSSEIAAHTHNLRLRRDEGSQNNTGFVPDEAFANAFGRNTSDNNQDAGTLLTDRSANTISHTTESAGSGQAHNIVQKTAYIAQNLFIYY